MEIAIFGALDRYNYGDLLFPLILQEYLSKNNNDVSIQCYGLIESDLREYGAVKTRPFGEFFNKFKKTDSKNIIIIAGGRVIGPTASLLYSFLKNTPMLNFFSNLTKVLFLPNPVDSIARSKLNVTWGDYPFCPAKPNSRTLLIYNAVGGNPKRVPKLIDNLKCADYISVRNPPLFNKLKNFIDADKLTLCPDSAAVISKIWPRDILTKIVTSEAADIPAAYKEGYIVFQAKAKTKWHIGTIAQQLTLLHHKTNLPILLVPIGRAYRHEDHLLLEKLARRLDVPSRLADVSNLHDIMYLISCSSLFIGTSLHGNITAMSYAVPHLGITNIRKLDQYLKYWDIEPNNITGTVRTSEICGAALNVLQKADNIKLQEHAEYLSNLSHKDLKTIAGLVDEYITANP